LNFIVRSKFIINVMYVCIPHDSNSSWLWFHQIISIIIQLFLIYVFSSTTLLKLNWHFSISKFRRLKSSVLSSEPPAPAHGQHVLVTNGIPRVIPFMFQFNFIPWVYVMYLYLQTKWLFVLNAHTHVLFCKFQASHTHINVEYCFQDFESRQVSKTFVLCLVAAK
jgi:hypothetical protein